jgi:hypothetical protein
MMTREVDEARAECADCAAELKEARRALALSESAHRVTSAELRDARAECERMRAVYEAAVEWRRMNWHDGQHRVGQRAYDLRDAIDHALTAASKRGDPLTTG